MIRRLVGTIVFFLVIFLIDLYVYQAVKTVFADVKPQTFKLISIGYWLVTAFTFSFFIAANLSNPREWPDIVRTLVILPVMIFLLAKMFVLVFVLIDDLRRGLIWIFDKFSAKEQVVDLSRSRFISSLALMAGALPLVVMSWGIIRNAYNFKFHRHDILLPNLPTAFHNFKVIQLSDIHSGSFTRTSPLPKIISRINEEKPDLILFTGDLVNSIAEEMEPYKHIFKELKASSGKYSIMGNHDYGDYAYGKSPSAKKDAHMKQFEAIHEFMGWKLLRNEHTYVEKDGEKIALLGVENWSGKINFGQYGKLQQTCEGCEAPVKILMSHDPSHWDGEVRKTQPDIDLTLSGHTHGAQFGIEIGKLRWSPVKYVYDQWGGLYQKGKQYLYVNRGFGCLGYPGRIGIMPEITVLTLKKEV